MCANRVSTHCVLILVLHSTRHRLSEATRALQAMEKQGVCQMELEKEISRLTQELQEVREKATLSCVVFSSLGEPTERAETKPCCFAGARLHEVQPVVNFLFSVVTVLAKRIDVK